MPVAHGRARHTVVGCARWVLRDRDAADRLDVADADGTVGGGARHHHADRAILRRLRERPEEEVDGHVLRVVARPWREGAARLR